MLLHGCRSETATGLPARTSQASASSGTGLSRPGMKSSPAPYESTVHIAANHRMLQTIEGKSQSFLAKRWVVNFAHASIS
ncbi:hypothetical protein GCM10010313_79940 [Streptomyces violarus]|nr:hypothetical protein GCM10010313_79940 [Streptomyces violarus]